MTAPEKAYLLMLRYHDRFVWPGKTPKGWNGKPSKVEVENALRKNGYITGPVFNPYLTHKGAAALDAATAP